MNIGEKIKHRRLELGYSLEEVSTKLGIAKTTVRAWELNQTRKISATSLSKLAEILKVKPTYFIYEDEDEYEFLTELTEIDLILIKAIHKLEPIDKMQVYKFLIEKGLIKNEN